MESKRDLHAQWSSFRKRVLQLLTVVRHPDSRLLAFAFIEVSSDHRVFQIILDINYLIEVKGKFAKICLKGNIPIL